MYSTQEEEPGLPVSAIDIWEEQHKDPEITKLFQSLAEKDYSVQDQYEIIEDKLYHQTHLANGQVHYRIYVPAILIPTILQHYHAHPLNGHLGIYKTYQRVHQVAFWPAMWTSVKQCVKRCIKCQTLKNENRKPAGKIQQTTTTRPKEMLGVDIMGPLPRSSLRH